MNVKKNILWRAYISFMLVFLLAVGVMIQMFRLQVVKRPELLSLRDSLNTEFHSIEALRGNIYAEDGKLLATSVPIYEARIDFMVESLTKEVFRKNIDSLAWCLSMYFKDKSAEDYKRDLVSARKNKLRYYLLKKNLTHTQIKEIRQFPIFRMGRYKGGLIAVQDNRRIRPFGILGQRTIGYVRKTVMPVGIEGAFDNYLHGQDGRRLMQRVSGGAWLPVNEENEIEPKDGKDIITTIDVNIQDLTETALHRVLVRNDADNGCAVVLEVATGKIKAIANLTKESEGLYTEKYNYAIGASTEPGSTFKLASLLALLEIGKISPNMVIDTKGGEVRFHDRVMKDAKLGHGVVTLSEGFRISSNVAISLAMEQVFGKNPSVFTDYINSLKLNQSLGLSIPGEGKPFVKNPTSKDWSGVTLPWMSIGYEIRLTPMQILTLYNAIANNGTMVKPYFVSEIQEVGKPVIKFNPQVLNPKICSDQTLKIVRDLLVGVVETGTATNIKNTHFPIAGKTGTAQVAKNGSGYKLERNYQSSFAGYFPANNPKYSIIVVVNNPSKGAYYGSAVAAPAFKEIAEKIYAKMSPTPDYLASFKSILQSTLPLNSKMPFNYFSALTSVYQGYGLVVSGQPDNWVKPNTKKNTIAIESFKFQRAKVPDVRGMVLSDAIYVLESAGLKVKFHGAGKVRSQSIQAGSIVTQKQVIELKLG